MERWAPLTGVLFTVLLAVAFFVSGNTPDSKDSGEKVVSHYDNANKFYVALIALFIATVAFMFFNGVLRSTLTRHERIPSWLSSTVFGGGVVYAVGLTVFGITQFALLDAADKNQVQVAQTLNVLDNDNFFPTVVGLAIVLLAVAAAVLGTTPRVIPTWLGWVALVLGVVSFLGPLGFIAFLAFPIWTLVVAVVLYRQASSSAQTPPDLAGGGRPVT